MKILTNFNMITYNLIINTNRVKNIDNVISQN